MLELLDKKDGKVIGFKAQGTISGDDFHQILAPSLAAMIQDCGKARVLLHLGEGFQGFDLDALKEEAFGSKVRDSLEKIAVVGGSWMINLQIRLGAAMLGGEVQTFASEELDDAWDWVRT